MYVPYCVHHFLVLCFCGGLLTRSHRHCQLFLLVIRTIKVIVPSMASSLFLRFRISGLHREDTACHCGHLLGPSIPLFTKFRLFVGRSEFMTSFIHLPFSNSPRRTENRLSSSLCCVPSASVCLRKKQNMLFPIRICVDPVLRQRIRPVNGNSNGA